MTEEMPPTGLQTDAADERIVPISDAKAHALFENFLKAESCSDIIVSFTRLRQHVFEGLEKTGNYRHPYCAFKSCITLPKARELWSKLDARANHVDYAQGEACKSTKVLVIGAGPCGLRFAIEGALLGAEVVVLEKRSLFSRNNVLHLWPYLITDLRNIGAKIFYPKFSVGGIDHISIRRLQSILLKTALLLGVQIHMGTSYEGLVEPSGQPEVGELGPGWRASVTPEDSPVSQYQFDVLIGADGKKNTLPGFRRKEFRGKMAIAITFNFVNHRTKAEAMVPEVGGLACYARLEKFRDLKDNTGIDLENFVYYKNETHYFVMTAKKTSLLKKGVLINNYTDSQQLLHKDNVDEDNLLEYAKEAAVYVTGLPSTEFEQNHYGKADIDIFDFTSMCSASSASYAMERRGRTLLMGLVGDSLLEPFWPTGTGCARGFLAAFDSAWMMKAYCSGEKPLLSALAERESLYKILPQSAPSSLHKNFNAFSLDPCTRYKSLFSDKPALTAGQVRHLLDTDNPEFTANQLEGQALGNVPSHHNQRSVPSLQHQSNAPSHNVQSNAPSQHHQSNAPSQNVQSNAPSQHHQSNAPSHNVQSNAPSQHHQSNVPSHDVQSNAPSQLHQTNAPSHNGHINTLPHQDQGIVPSHHGQSNSSSHYDLSDASSHNDQNNASSHHDQSNAPSHQDQRNVSSHHDQSDASFHHDQSNATSHHDQSNATSHHDPSDAPSHHDQSDAQSHHDQSDAQSHHDQSDAPSHHDPSDAPSHHDQSNAQSHHDQSNATSHHDPSNAPSHHDQSNAQSHHDQSNASSHHDQSNAPSHHDQSNAQFHHDQSDALSHHDQSNATSHHDPSDAQSHHDQSDDPSHHDQSDAPSHHDQSNAPSHYDQSDAQFHHDQSDAQSHHEQSDSQSYNDQSDAPFHSDQSEAPFHHDQSDAQSHHDQSDAQSHHDQSDAPFHHDQSDAQSHHDQSDAPSHHDQSDAPSHHDQSDAQSHHDQSDAQSHHDQSDAQSHQHQSDAPSHHDQSDAQSDHD